MAQNSAATLAPKRTIILAGITWRNTRITKLSSAGPVTEHWVKQRHFENSLPASANQPQTNYLTRRDFPDLKWR